MTRQKKTINLGFRSRHRSAFRIGKVFLLVATIAIAPFALFYLIATIYLGQGDRLFDAGKFTEAIEAYETALAFNSNSDRAYVKIARALQREKRYTEALEAYDRAYLIDPNPDPARVKDLLQLGDALGKQQAWIEAIEAYRKAIAIAPDSSQAQLQLGLAFQALERWEESAKALQKSIELEPLQTRAYFYLGKAYSQQKLWESASNAYEQARQFNPEDARIFQPLGESLQEQGKWAESAKIYLEGITIAPQNSELYNRLGKALAEQGKTNESIVVFQQALRLSPKNAKIRENLCYSHLNLGEVDEGLNWCRQAVKLDPNLANARFVLQEIERGRLIHDNPSLLTRSETIPSRALDPLVTWKRSIVKIIVRERGRGAVGTGWIVRRDIDRAWIVTNRHVVTDSQQEVSKKAQIFVEFYSNPPEGQIRKRSRAKIRHVPPPTDGLDVAVLEIQDPPGDIQPLKLAPLSIEPDQPVISIGNPFNKPDWTVTKGVVNDNTDKSLTLSMLVVPGQSGSPVLNQQKQVVGMISQSGLFCPGNSGGNALEAVKLGCGLAIPVDRIREQLIQWKVIR